MKYLSSFGREYLLLFLAVLATMAAGRLYEIATLGYYHSLSWVSFAYISGAVIRDLQWSLAGALILWPVYYACKQFLPGRRVQLTTLCITLAGLANILLINYFAATLTPLGPEFWAYSLWEMGSTAVASGRVNLWSLLLLVGLALVIYYPVRFILDRDPDAIRALHFKWALPLAGVFMLIPPSWILPSGESAVTNYRSNKLAYFISSGFESASPENTYDYSSIEQEYPFLHPAARQSELGPFFEDFKEPPNLVFLIVESLGGEFVGSNGQWTGFAPNLDSLARGGLYWENGLSLSGRTFGMMPSIFGSLPPGTNGFMELGPDYPAHQTLISLLDERGYRTSLFSGFNTYFDKLDFFLEYQGIDFVLNKQRIEEAYVPAGKADTENYWGYDDKTMLGIASSILDTADTFPRLDIYHTLQSHSPFTVPDPKEYEQKFDRLVSRMDVDASKKDAYRQYRAELTTLLYADEAVGAFMEAYRKRPHFENTIFVITGDHWLIPVPQTSQISRYHVPIIIYSPLIKKPVHFKSVNTHAGLVPGLTSLLEQKTALSFPDSVHWIGSSMDTARSFRNTHSIPLMKNKNRLDDYLHEGYYLSGDRLFQLEEGLRLGQANDEEVKSLLEKELSQFKLRNQYALTKNKLYPGSSTGEISGRYAFLTEYDTLFARIDSIGLNADEQFQRARQLAFDGEYEPARAITKRLLLEHPDYHDVQLLAGRTYAWQGNYDRARGIFSSLLEKDPGYYDTYNALFDVEYWDGNTESALEVINQGLSHHPNREQFLVKKIRALAALNRTKEARQVFNTLQENHPKSDSLKELRSLFTD
ncbi:MAG TPA: sulfatase-like hydrolase/transferase [Halalkalibaculum sp.]|nr:sulfatase-like hydrolase/transferase [Halalkalibaculum sp.]